MNIALPTMTEPSAIRAGSVDAPFLRTLRRSGFHGRVHSVFKRVVNIEDDAGELFTLACRGVDNAPNTAILDIGGFDTADIAVNDQITGTDEKLSVGNRLEVLLTEASGWDRELPGYPAAVGVLRANLRLLRSHLAHVGEAGGMLARRGAVSEFDAAVTALLGQRATSLVQALSRADFACACRHAKSMLGLGPGLTPSGDDFLVGLFAVLNIPASPCHGWLGGGADVLDGAERSTNAISLAALTQAADGRVRESIAALIEHLMYGAPQGLIAPLRRVLAIGSTSGSDIVAGILCGFELNISHGGMRSCQSK